MTAEKRAFVTGDNEWGWRVYDNKGRATSVIYPTFRQAMAEMNALTKERQQHG